MLPRMYTEKPEGKYDYDRQKKNAFYTSIAHVKPLNLFLANWYFVPDYLLYLSSQAKISKN